MMILCTAMRNQISFLNFSKQNEVKIQKPNTIDCVCIDKSKKIFEDFRTTNMKSIKT